MAESRTDDGPDTEMRSEEDDTTSTKVVVDGIREPATDKGRTEIRTSVDNTKNKTIASSIRITDTVDLGEEDVGTVGTGLIPTLDGSTDGASRDGEEQLAGHVPLVSRLTLDDRHLTLSERLGAGDGAVVVGVLGDERALSEEGNVLGEALFLGPVVDIAHELVIGNALKRVSDFCLEVGRKIDVFGVHSLGLVIRVGSSSLGLRIDVRHGGQLVDESSICVVVLYIRGDDERLL